MFTKNTINIKKTATIILIILAVFACNTKQSKKSENHGLIVEKPTFEKANSGKTESTQSITFKPYDSLAAIILTTSPRFKQLTNGLNKAIIKNGGQSFELNLERSPYRNQNKHWAYSRTYDFLLYESYTERQLNIAQFSFDPDSMQLYEYDAARDKQIAIKFDRNLLPKFEALNK